MRITLTYRINTKDTARASKFYNLFVTLAEKFAGESADTTSKYYFDNVQIDDLKGYIPQLLATNKLHLKVNDAIELEYTENNQLLRLRLNTLHQWEKI